MVINRDALWAAVGKADVDEYYDQRFAFQKQSFSVRSAFLATNLRKLVYISCYPETLAHDLRDFRQQGWNLDRLYVADMFSNTP